VGGDIHRFRPAVKGNDAGGRRVRRGANDDIRRPGDTVDAPLLPLDRIPLLPDDRPAQRRGRSQPGAIARAIEREDRLVHHDALGGWLLRVATTVCLDHLRRRRIERRATELVDPLDGAEIRASGTAQIPKPRPSCATTSASP